MASKEDISSLRTELKEHVDVHTKYINERIDGLAAEIARSNNKADMKLESIHQDIRSSHNIKK